MNYERLTLNYMKPKLAFHGFKYDEEESNPPQGHFVFSRKYWCMSQSVMIWQVEYDLEQAKAVISHGIDFPTEVAAHQLLTKEVGFRLWLSNRFLSVVLQSEHRSHRVVPRASPVREAVPDLDSNEKLSWLPAYLDTCWEFQGEATYKQVLEQIGHVIVDEGLDWFEEQIADVKNYHKKLEERRLAAKRLKSSI